MRFQLSSQYKPTGDQPTAIEKLVSGIKKDEHSLVLLGVTGSGKTFTIANVIQQVQKPTLIISHNKTLAAQLYQEFKEFFPKNAVQYFVSYYDYYQPEAYIPQRDLYIEKDSDINEEIDKLRLAATAALMTREDVIVVASVSAIYNLGSPLNYKNAMALVEVGKGEGPQKLQAQLINLYYERNDVDFKRGTFRIRGNAVDIYVSYADVGVRVTFMGDSVTMLELFNPIDGSILEDYSYYVDMLLGVEGEIIQKVALYPAKHYVVDETLQKQAIEKIMADTELRVKEFEKQGKMIEAHRLKQKVQYDMEMVREIGYCKGIENYSYYFDGRELGQAPYSLMDYFPKDYLLIMDESHMTIPQVRGMFNGDQARKENLIEYGFRLPTARENRPLRFSEFEERMGYTVFLSATPEEYEMKKAGKENIAEQLIRPTGIVDPVVEIRPASNQVQDLVEEIKKVIEKKERVLVTTMTKRMAEDLSEYLKQGGVRVTYLHSDIDTMDRTDILADLRAGNYDVLVGINLLREGLDLPEVSLVAILDADKEGFLRSRTSLIQTMGRAARHVEGRVILYAEKKTHSMQEALFEVERRRKIQLEYNEKMGITPASIQKAIRQRILPKLVEESDEARDQKIHTMLGKDIEIMTASYRTMPKKEQKSTMDWLTKEMKKEAMSLNFEKAIELRELIRSLKK
ncbi:excinuclease ABC subunit UvrB [bacterium]|nr:excinuclease ABC subunit UvrB [bacterium]